MLLDNQRLPLILALVAGAAMVALTGWQGYQFWQTVSQQSQFGAVEPLVDGASGIQEPPKVELATLSLFGSASSGGTPQEIDTENLPETNLRLALRGVLAAQGDFPGSALIEDDKGNTEAYLVGDELPGNATLRSVHPNRVIIARSGKLENLYFPETEDRSGMSFAAEADEEPATAAQPTEAQNTVRSPANSASDEQRREEIRRRLEQLRERLRTNN
ncbi:type II secretion system protein N [Marinobacter sp.]|uniref:type II secretion system protein N n=1 Tax=Marinobacter sp. TaxID=50741 RepID=UPI0035C77587